MIPIIFEKSRVGELVDALANGKALTALTDGWSVQDMLLVADVLQALGQRAVTRLLVEGGGRLAASLFQAELVDRLVWFHAPSVIGGDGVAAVGGFGLERLAVMSCFQRRSALPIGADLVETYARAR